MNLFPRIFKGEKPRVYLGAMLVASSEEWESLDGWGIFQSMNLGDGLRKYLYSAVNLPPIDSREDLRESDLGLELVVVNYRGGEFGAFQTTELFIPIFWRPKVELKARLYNLATGKTVHIASSKKNTPWGQFVSRIFSFNRMFRFKPLFDEEDMEVLLCLAAIETLAKLTKKL
ncbi:hypothetical protein HC024_05415 [Methylococcaceae bacterium WWC4]|nr:hypothetical protein [Methylococcaceae bacterium WWC4]